MTESVQPIEVEPAAFLAQAASSPEGWSVQYGGPAGVALLMPELQRRLNEQSAELAAVRAAAINELLVTHSLAEVARMLGVSRQAVSKAARGPRWSEPRW